MKFHELFKIKRMEIGTVREFARESGLDLAYVSRLENGVVLPPKDGEKLARLAVALGIAEGSDEWREFMDLAAVARNELPEDLRDDERVAKVLPAFYRALRDKELDEGEFRRLIDLIGESEEEE
jgi:transcriptional regulator with XRE-family HTH domain